MPTWQDYTADKAPGTHTVVGNLKVCRDVFSPQLNNHRDLLLYLPPGYDDESTHFPVIYMHDGQNLFDAFTNFAGEWQVDETLERLADEGLRAVVVGIPHMDDDRRHEYSPYPHEDAQFDSAGHGEQYMQFLVETVKPLIDADFRTIPDREHTLVMGSSMGGLISLYAFFSRPDIFGRAGALSPALWFGEYAILEMIAAATRSDGRLYVDVGTREYAERDGDAGSHEDYFRRYLADVRRLRDLLNRKGYQAPHSLLYVEEEGAIHREAAWARRLPDALRFLLEGLSA